MSAVIWCGFSLFSMYLWLFCKQKTITITPLCWHTHIRSVILHTARKCLRVSANELENLLWLFRLHKCVWIFVLAVMGIVYLSSFENLFSFCSPSFSLKRRRWYFCPIILWCCVIWLWHLLAIKILFCFANDSSSLQHNNWHPVLWICYDSLSFGMWVGRGEGDCRGLIT